MDVLDALRKHYRMVVYIAVVIAVLVIGVSSLDLRAVLTGAIFGLKALSEHVPWELLALSVLILARSRTRSNMLRAVLLVALVLIIGNFALQMLF